MTKLGLLKKAIKVSLASIAGILALAGVVGSIYNASRETKTQNEKNAYVEKQKYTQEYKERFTNDKSGADDEFINGKLSEEEYIEKVAYFVSNEYAEKVINEGNNEQSKAILASYNKKIDTYKKGIKSFVLVPLSSIPFIASKAIKTEPNNTNNEEENQII